MLTVHVHPFIDTFNRKIICGKKAVNLSRSRFLSFSSVDHSPPPLPPPPVQTLVVDFPLALLTVSLCSVSFSLCSFYIKLISIFAITFPNKSPVNNTQGLVMAAAYTRHSILVGCCTLYTIILVALLRGE